MKKFKTYFIAIIFLYSTGFADNNATEVVEKFMRDSVEYRLSYLYRNKFCKDSDREKLRISAKKACRELDAIVSVYRSQKKRIEEYSGDDWDVKFGVTGRWRQVVSDFDSAVQLRNKMDYYLALPSDPNEKGGNEGFVEADANGFEASVRTAFAQLRTGDDSGLSNVIEQWSQTRYFFGQIVLDHLESSGDFDGLTTLETKLAAESALAADCSRYKNILAEFAKSHQFAEPIVLYAAGVGYAQSEPNQAIEYFIQASRSSGEIGLVSAAEAARVVYQLYNSSQSDCPFAINVFRNYMDVAGEQVDETLQYCYSQVLRGCGEETEAAPVLEKIAAGNGQFAHQAEFELILSSQEKNKAEKLRRLIDKILNSDPVDKQLRYEVLTAYCRGQLESADINDVLTVIDVVAEIKEVDCRLGEYVLVALSKIVERIDEYEADLLDSVVQNCYNVAGGYFNCFEGQQKTSTRLLRAELGFFAGTDIDVRQFLESLEAVVDNNSVDALRCRARLLMAEGKYESAGILWSKIADSKRSLTKANSLCNWQWSRAKFYELNCASKIKQADADEIKHSIEVLLYSRSDIPAFWKKKLMEMLRKNHE